MNRQIIMAIVILAMAKTIEFPLNLIQCAVGLFLLALGINETKKGKTK